MLANMVIAVSNLYACRVILTLMRSRSWWGACIFLGSMTFSFLFHLFETNEVSSNISLLFGRTVYRVEMIGFLGQQSLYGEMLLMGDRVFAVMSVLHLCFTIYYRTSSGMTQFKWNDFAIRAVMGLLCLLYSDIFARNINEYVILHCVWHICAYDLALRIAHLNCESSLWVKDRARN